MNGRGSILIRIPALIAAPAFLNVHLLPFSRKMKCPPHTPPKAANISAISVSQDTGKVPTIMDTRLFLTPSNNCQPVKWLISHPVSSPTMTSSRLVLVTHPRILTQACNFATIKRVLRYAGLFFVNNILPATDSLHRPIIPVRSVVPDANYPPPISQLQPAVWLASSAACLQ